MERELDGRGTRQKVHADYLGFFEEYFLFLQSNLMSGYKMNPLDIEELYLGEVLYYNFKISQLKEEERLLEVMRYKTLVSIIHGEPNHVLEILDQISKGEVVDDEIGDIQAIERLKNRRGKG